MRLSATRLTSIAQAGGGRTLIQRAIAILRRFGNDAHVYLPGVGMLNGLQAANYIDSAGTQAGAVDQPVGLVLDAGGGLGVELVIANHVSWVPSGTGAYTRAAAGWGGLGGSGTGTAGKTYQISFKVDAVTAGNSLGVYRRNAANTDNELMATISVVAGGVYTSVALVVFDIAIYDLWLDNNTFAGTVSGVVVREVTGIHASQATTSAKPILRMTSGKYNWVFDATDSLTATFPAGNESVTVIDALGTGQVTTAGVNVVGAYNMGPSVTLYGRMVIKGSLSASELATLQSYANRLAGV